MKGEMMDRYTNSYFDNEEEILLEREGDRLSSLSDPIEEVKVIPGGGRPLGQPRSELEVEGKSDPADETLAFILDTAEEQIRMGRDLIVKGLKMFSVVETPQHPNLPTLIGQQIEQVIEYRRIKR